MQSVSTSAPSAARARAPRRRGVSRPLARARPAAVPRAQPTGVPRPLRGDQAAHTRQRRQARVERRGRRAARGGPLRREVTLFLKGGRGERHGTVRARASAAQRGRGSPPRAVSHRRAARSPSSASVAPPQPQVERRGRLRASKAAQGLLYNIMRPRSRFVGPARCALEGCTWLCKEDESTNPLLCGSRRGGRQNLERLRPIAQAQGARIACALQQPRVILILIDPKPRGGEKTEERTRAGAARLLVPCVPAGPSSRDRGGGGGRRGRRRADADARARGRDRGRRGRSAPALAHAVPRDGRARAAQSCARPSLARAALPLMLMSLLVWAICFQTSSPSRPRRHAARVLPDGCAATGHPRHTVDDDGGAAAAPRRRGAAGGAAAAAARPAAAAAAAAAASTRRARTRSSRSSTSARARSTTCSRARCPCRRSTRTCVPGAGSPLSPEQARRAEESDDMGRQYGNLLRTGCPASRPTPTRARRRAPRQQLVVPRRGCPRRASTRARTTRAAVGRPAPSARAVIVLTRRARRRPATIGGSTSRRCRDTEVEPSRSARHATSATTSASSRSRPPPTTGCRARRRRRRRGAGCSRATTRRGGARRRRDRRRVPPTSTTRSPRRRSRPPRATRSRPRRTATRRPGAVAATSATRARPTSRSPRLRPPTRPTRRPTPPTPRTRRGGRRRRAARDDAALRTSTRGLGDDDRRGRTAAADETDGSPGRGRAVQADRGDRGRGRGGRRRQRATDLFNHTNACSVRRRRAAAATAACSSHRTLRRLPRLPAATCSGGESRVRLDENVFTSARGPARHGLGDGERVPALALTNTVEEKETPRATARRPARLATRAGTRGRGAVRVGRARARVDEPRASRSCPTSRCSSRSTAFACSLVSMASCRAVLLARARRAVAPFALALAVLPRQSSRSRRGGRARARARARALLPLVVSSTHTASNLSRGPRSSNAGTSSSRSTAGSRRTSGSGPTSSSRRRCSRRRPSPSAPTCSPLTRRPASA